MKPRILLTSFAALVLVCSAGAAEPERQPSTATAVERMMEIDRSILLKRYEKVAIELEETESEMTRLRSEGVEEKVVLEKLSKKNNALWNQYQELRHRLLNFDEAVKAEVKRDAEEKAEAKRYADERAAAKAKADAERKAGK